MTNARRIWTFWRGDWHEGDARILGAASHGAWQGSMVFDGARVFDGVAPDLDRHCARLNDSARAMGLVPAVEAGALEALARDGAARFDAGEAVYIRPMCWAEDSLPGLIPPDPDSADFALCLEAIPMAEPTGVTLTTTRFRRPTLETAVVDAKASCLYPNNARILREAQSKGFGNALVQDQNGNVAELASANVFMVRGGEVFTPIPNGTFLNGITRQRVIALLREAGFLVHETTLTVDDFRTAEEIFSTGNLSKVSPVTGFEDLSLAIGPVTRRARQLYLDWAHS